jgi:hypothetical protein
MFWGDHAPPHFHALYAEYEVLIDIHTLEVVRGSMPRRALALVLEWAFAHRALRYAFLVLFTLLSCPLNRRVIFNIVDEKLIIR